MTTYTSATDADRREMLAAIGVRSIEDLFESIPPDLRLDRPLDLPDGRSEAEVHDELRRLAARNVSADDELTFYLTNPRSLSVAAAVELTVSVARRLLEADPVV